MLAALILIHVVEVVVDHHLVGKVHDARAPKAPI
jgi:hypothetical protein